MALESPTYAGALDCVHDSGARVLPVPVDADGLVVEVLERHLARHEVKLVVLQPTSHSPTGRDLSPERRRRLGALARERSFFVLEDGVYATTRFDGPPGPRLRAEAPSHVLYVDSLSKTIGGGLRVGWVAARGPVLERLVALKMTADVQTATLSQHLAARWLASGRHEAHLARTLPVYAERRDALLAALRRHLGAEARVSRPLGGHHVWVTLRRPVPERALAAEALRQGVSFLAGSAALPDPGAAPGMRLSFALLEPDELREGVRRLARALARTRERAVGSLPVG